MHTAARQPKAQLEGNGHSTALTALLAMSISLLLTGTGLSQQAPLTVERIFDSQELAAKSYSVNWMPAGGRYFVLRSSAKQAGKSIVLVDPLKPNGDPQKEQVLLSAEQLIPPGATRPIDVESFQVSPDRSKVLVFNNSKRVWRYNTRGDYWVVDLSREKDSKDSKPTAGPSAGTVKKLGAGRTDSANSSLMFAKFSPDSKSVAYVRDRNIFVEELESGRVYQITKTENDNIINGTSDWVYEEELDLRDAFAWSDDGNQIVFWRFDTRGVGLFTMINNTDQLYPKLIQFQYPKVGTTNSAVSIGVFNMASGVTRYVDFPGDPRNNYPAQLNWIPGTDEFLIQRLNRLQNENTVYAVNAKTGAYRTVFVDRDSAWVEVCDQIQFTSDGKQFTFISESDGWKHVYLVDVATGKRELLTPGEFDVIELYRVDTETRQCFFQASPEDAKCRYLYRQKFGDSKLDRLTPADQVGWHDYRFSADGTSAVHTWSRMTQPPTINTIRLPDHTRIRVEQDNQALKRTMASLAPQRSEFIKLDIEDEANQPLSIDASIMYPMSFDGSGKTQYPLLVYVYGEPWGTTVTDRWDGSRYLWHRMLCEQGYIVMSFDNRGAKCPRGAKWRKAIYQKIGIVNARDQAESLKAALKSLPFIDENRVGIWGWSGGGSSTLNAMFQYPELYRMGISVAPVPDQRYYDTIYQERYMRTPKLNPDGFKNGSPISHAGNLKGDLLLIHGTGDDNCHYQTMELLINKLIALDKSFEMMAYPNRSHAIREYENTTPHLRKLMTRFLLEHLPVN